MTDIYLRQKILFLAYTGLCLGMSVTPTALMRPEKSKQLHCLHLISQNNIVKVWKYGPLLCFVQQRLYNVLCHVVLILHVKIILSVVRAQATNYNPQ